MIHLSLEDFLSIRHTYLKAIAYIYYRMSSKQHGHHQGKHPRSSSQHSDIPRFLNPNPSEHNWIRTIPDIYPDILRAPAVSYKSERDDPRIKSNKYIAYARPYRCKQGLLMIGLEQRCVIIDESQTDKPHIIPMLLDREAITGTWIFAVSIYQAEGIIQIEDCIVSNGEQIRSSKSFNERYTLLQRFADTIWFQDKRFQLNWQIQVAEVFPLVDIKSAVAKVTGGCLCLMPDSHTFRLIKVIPQIAARPIITGGPQNYICFPVEGKPDVYDLKKSDGTDLGRACIQTLSISQALQLKKSTGQPLKVMAEWNGDFESYIVTSVL